jgi:cytochrome c556
MRRITLLAATATIWAAAMAAVPIAAHEGATGIIKQRMDAMEQLAQMIKSIEERAGRGGEFATIANDAASLKLLTAKMPEMFPPGSDQHPSDVNKAVWTRRAEFDAINRKLEQALGQMAVAAERGDRTLLAAELRQAKQTCLDCHAVFRTKRSGH